MGIGDWGLGIGPNPQSPIPNPQSPIPNIIIYHIIHKNNFYIFIYYYDLYLIKLQLIEKYLRLIYI